MAAIDSQQQKASSNIILRMKVMMNFLNPKRSLENGHPEAACFTHTLAHIHSLALTCMHSNTQIRNGAEKEYNMFDKTSSFSLAHLINRPLLLPFPLITSRAENSARKMHEHTQNCWRKSVFLFFFFFSYGQKETVCFTKYNYTTS